jgi:hypothetical protein
MNTPTEMPIEDRLRAHFEDRARSLAIPGPEHDTAVARARERLPMSADADDRLARRRHRRRGPLLAAAAVVALIALVAGVTMARRDDRTDVSTDPTPAPTIPSTTDPTRPNETPATTEAPPTSTTSVPGAPLPTGAIVAREGILGSWDGTSWVRWRPGDPAPTAREYQVVGVGDSIETVTGVPVEGCGPNGEPSVDLGFTWDAEAAPVAVAGAGELRPRPVEVLDPTAVTYRSAAAQVASDRGIAQPAPEVRQVVRADLDGDGTTEVVVVADQSASSDPTLIQPGDWSVIFERRVVGGAVETVVLDWDVWDGTSDAVPPAVERYHVTAVADLNGDGRLEVAVTARFWESVATTVWATGPGGLLGEVLSASCGA